MSDLYVCNAEHLFQLTRFTVSNFNSFVQYFFVSSLGFWEFIKESSHRCLKLGHVAYFLIGPFKFYVLTDPDDIFLLSNTCFQKDEFSYEFTKQLLGAGLLYAPVPTWKRHRKLISPAFNQQILDSFLVIFNKQGRKLVDSMQVEVGRGWFDQSKYVKQNFMETICQFEQWRHVATEENPVDCASRGLQSSELLNYELWCSGPAWLSTDTIPTHANKKRSQIQTKRRKLVFLQLC
nr:cytochrome P450 4V2-like [Danaus plexippus plexippus]